MTQPVIQMCKLYCGEVGSEGHDEENSQFYRIEGSWHAIWASYSLLYVKNGERHINFTGS